MAVHADLHVHTTRSDGDLAVADVPAAARRAGVAAVAITDHDRLPPVDRPVVERDGVTLVAGIELRVDAGDQRVDLLGYGASPTPALERELDSLQTDRVERARRIADCVEDRLGVTLDVAFEHGVGRPHVARAVADAVDDYDVDRAFADLIGADGPCYAARSVPDFETGLGLLDGACAVVALAHPLRYPDPAAALARAADLDAVERHYPYDGPVDHAPVDRAIRDHDLLATGGSDAHGTTLGIAGLDRESYARLEDRFLSPTS